MSVEGGYGLTMLLVMILMEAMACPYCLWSSQWKLQPAHTTRAHRSGSCSLSMLLVVIPVEGGYGLPTFPVANLGGIPKLQPATAACGYPSESYNLPMLLVMIPVEATAWRYCSS